MLKEESTDAALSFDRPDPPPGYGPASESESDSDSSEGFREEAEAAAAKVQCTAGGQRPQESDFKHCATPQSFVRCGPHNKAEISVFDSEDVDKLHDLWWRYRDDLTWPQYEKKPRFSDPDFDTFFEMAQKVVDAMVEEYGEPMVLDQATISNTNHIGHPPHADNVQFDSVWWKGKRIRQEDEVVAAREGAYVLWRSEKTSYRSYSCSVALSDPDGYEGGEVQFFETWGEKVPSKTYKCQVGRGIAFCGCNKNIHAVTGVKWGFRLVFLVWTRPPGVRVPDSQAHVCYFRPGTGLGVWLTTADVMRHRAMKREKAGQQALVWLPTEDDDETCQCDKCIAERQNISWKDRDLISMPTTPDECKKAAEDMASSPATPTTSAGNSPRHGSTQENSDTTRRPSGPNSTSGSSGSSDDFDCSTGSHEQHCPHPQGTACCRTHDQVELKNVVTKSDIKELRRIWDAYQDDLSRPWYEKKPEFSHQDFCTFKAIAEKVVSAMAEKLGEPLELDQATVSNTNHIGHPPHADNVQFDSVWWRGRKIKQRDELTASRHGGAVLWKQAKTSYRNYSASVSLTEPSKYGGGELEFYNSWGQKDPDAKYKSPMCSGVAFCGCQKNIHAVTGVKWGFRLQLLIWTRPQGVEVPEDQRYVCYFRPGTGMSVWLTTADLLAYPQKSRSSKRNSWRRNSWRRRNKDNDEESWQDWEEWEDAQWNEDDHTGDEADTSEGTRWIGSA